MNSKPQIPPQGVSIPVLPNQGRMEAVTTCSNLGVLLMRQKRFDEAIGCFRAVIEHVNERMLSAAPVDPRPCHSENVLRVQAFYFMLDGTNCPVQDTMSLPTLPKRPGQQSQDIYVFDNPIVISETQGKIHANDPIRRDEWLRVSQINLYNVAVTYHLTLMDRLEFLLQCNPSVDHRLDPRMNELMSLALAFYETTYRVLVSEKDILASQAMVILNNVGHIHKLKGNDEGSKKCFQYLLSTMMYLQETGGHENQIHQWDHFFSNVMDLILYPSPAPAA
ncbi:MAG: hypothetical protein SGILL_008255 [Bacillariaceae sp.]